MQDDSGQQPTGLLPYDTWTGEALRIVAVRALQFAAQHGLPDEHHFYISFRTDQPGVAVPTRLLAKYPQEMTIVLQHQFWDLKVEPERGQFSVGLSFGGVASKLVIPLAAMTGFADPHAQIALQFPLGGAVPAEVAAEPAEAEAPAPVEAVPSGPAEVVSLDQFRRRKE